VELMDMLAGFLIESFERRKQLVLIVDEAHNLGPRVLEEIRMLSGLETQKQKILHVILVGQPQLNTTLAAPELEQLQQRVRLRFHIGALSERETHAYVAHRLRVAGAPRPLFTDDGVAMVHRYAGGIPRLINTLCDTSLTCAFADDLEIVGTTSVEAAADELRWPPYAERPRMVSAAGVMAGSNGIQQPLSDPVALSLLQDIVTRIENIETLLTHALTRLERGGRKVSLALAPTIGADELDIEFPKGRED